MVDGWIKNGFPSPAATASKKFHFYDSVFLRVLAEKNWRADLFSQLFKKNDVQNIFCLWIMNQRYNRIWEYLHLYQHGHF